MKHAFRHSASSARRAAGGPSLRGRFIVLDGPDGCGKSTQLPRLARFLRRAGERVLTVKDPGTTAAGHAIRKILLTPAARDLAPETELFLYLAARAQLVAEAIAPALARGIWVLADRYSASTIAYQGYGPGRSPAEIDRIAALCRMAEGGVTPDLTVILDLPSETGLARLRRARDRMERKPLAYHRRVREGFLRQAARSGACAVLDAREDPRVIALKIEALAAPLLAR